jgi:hypothetical protein
MSSLLRWVCKGYEAENRELRCINTGYTPLQIGQLSWYPELRIRTLCGPPISCNMLPRMFRHVPAAITPNAGIWAKQLACFWHLSNLRRSPWAQDILHKVCYTWLNQLPTSRPQQAEPDFVPSTGGRRLSPLPHPPPDWSRCRDTISLRPHAHSLITAHPPFRLL